MRPELLDYEILSKAYVWLKNKKHWIKGDFGKGKKYEKTEDIADATATCALGALARAAGISDAACIEDTHACALLCEALPEGYTSVESYNDNPNTRHISILSLFTRAMTKAKKLATAPLRG